MDINSKEISRKLYQKPLKAGKRSGNAVLKTFNMIGSKLGN